MFVGPPAISTLETILELELELELELVLVLVLVRVLELELLLDRNHHSLLLKPWDSRLYAGWQAGMFPVFI